jgi:hypothetical protein
MAELIAARLRSLLDYDPDTGIFTWKFRTSNRIKVGDVAGYVNEEGYVQIGVDGKLYLAQRLAWLYVTGDWPMHDVDHWDTNPTNNAWKNLRDVPNAINAQNRRTPGTRNKSGYLGVSWSHRRQKWIAQVTIDGKQTNLGGYDTPEEAYQVYLAAKREHHEGCTI